MLVRVTIFKSAEIESISRACPEVKIAMKALCGRDIVHCADLCDTINKSQSNG